MGIQKKRNKARYNESCMAIRGGKVIVGEGVSGVISAQEERGENRSIRFTCIALDAGDYEE